MHDKSEKLKSLDNEKLIDVVKNYKQYRYDDELRNTAIEILEERGIDKEQLKLTGNLENKEYNTAADLYNAFGRSSKAAFTFYILIFITKIMVSIVSGDSSTLLTTIVVLFWSSLILYCTLLIKSFIVQSRFLKIIGKEYSSAAFMIYFLLGMPLYIIMYFYFRRQMSEEMKLIS